MERTPTASLRGVLHPESSRAHFTLSRHVPAADLAPHLEPHWITRWDLRGRAPFVSQVLPHPCVNVVVEPTQTRVWGVVTRRAERRLEGRGQAVGTKFRVGAFLPVLDRPLHELTDRSLALRDLVGPAADRLSRAVLAEPDEAAQVALMEAFWRERLGPPDPQVEAIGALLALELRDPSPSVDALARRHCVSARTLQRVFRRRVGVGPKWVLQCHRLHAATEHIAGDPACDLAALAIDLGYADQAHFTHDFRTYVGHSPGEYATACADAQAPMAA